MGYREKNKVFYFSATNWKREEEDVILHHDTWDEHWLLENERFEKLLQDDPNLVHFSNKMFFVWDENHCMQAWMPYINELHNNEPSWLAHIC